ncbi:MAG: DUF3365 domain-containing protein [Cyanobacteria bacterium J06597_1]
MIGCIKSYLIVLRETMFQKMNIGKKFNILLVIVFIVGLLSTGTGFAVILSRNAESQVVSKAAILLQTMVSVRDYTSNQVRPELADRLFSEREFLPQTVPGYSAREVFEGLRRDAQYSEFFYKEATLNPTNLRDKADRFESGIVEKFRQSSGLTELKGYRPSPAGRLYYIARPIKISKESCLECHSTPDAAPASLIETYGADNGFGWQLNEIVGAQMISVPASGIVNSAVRSFGILMGIVGIVFVLIFILTNIFLRKAVVSPIVRMADTADRISKGAMDAEFAATSSDEVGTLAAAFNRMRASLVVAMRMLEQHQGNKF